MERVPVNVTDFLWALILLRPYRCPHCFQCYFRPFSILMAIPVVGTLISAVMEPLGLMPTLKAKQITQYKVTQDSNNEVACSK